MELKVLIVDDNDLIHFLHKEVLEASELSKNPVIFSNGKETLDYLNDTQESDDTFLVLLDLSMPVMNGFELSYHLSGLHNSRNIHIVVVSSSVDENDKKKAFEYPNTVDFIEKPLTVSDCLRLKQLPFVMNN